MKFAPANILALLAFVIAPFLSSCSKEESAKETGPTELTLGHKTLSIEFAITRSEQRTGLMGREGIEDDHGMLFIYDTPQQMSYWMKNVDFPIDIGFFTSDGVLREVYPMYPQDTLARRSIGDDMLYALETRHRWFSENEIRPGAKLDLDQLREALANR